MRALLCAAALLPPAAAADAAPVCTHTVWLGKRPSPGCLGAPSSVDEYTADATCRQSAATGVMAYYKVNVTGNKLTAHYYNDSACSHGTMWVPGVYLDSCYNNYETQCDRWTCNSTAEESDVDVASDSRPQLGGISKYPWVAKWRGMHGSAVGLCTASLVAKEWIITAAHCATRMLKGESVKVQVTFTHGGGVERGVTRCVHANTYGGESADVALCKLKLPVNAFDPLTINSDLYKSNGKHGGPVMCVGTKGGMHATGPKALSYSGSGVDVYVSNEGGSGMAAGDSGGAWVHEMKNKTTNETLWVLTGVIHGGGTSGGKKRGIAVQPSYIREWIDKTTGGTAAWASGTA